MTRSCPSEELDHVRVCARCRARLVEADPARIFSLLAVRPVPPAVLESVSREVAAAIREPGATGTVAGHPAYRRVAAWAAALFLATATGSLLFVPLDSEAPGEAAGVATVDAGRASGVELLSSPGAARVVDVTVGDTQLVMIFDEDIHL